MVRPGSADQRQVRSRALRDMSSARSQLLKCSITGFLPVFCLIADPDVNSLRAFAPCPLESWPRRWSSITPPTLLSSPNLVWVELWHFFGKSRMAKTNLTVSERWDTVWATPDQDDFFVDSGLPEGSQKYYRAQISPKIPIRCQWKIPSFWQITDKIPIHKMMSFNNTAGAVKRHISTTGGWIQRYGLGCAIGLWAYAPSRNCSFNTVKNRGFSLVGRRNASTNCSSLGMAPQPL